jgi:hypothetical protein
MNDRGVAQAERQRRFNALVNADAERLFAKQEAIWDREKVCTFGRTLP